MNQIAELEQKIEQFKQELAAVKGNGHTNGVQAPATGPLKLDLGCGQRKQEGFVGVDVRKFNGVDIVCDLSREKWPWADNSVDEAFSSHSLEHLPGTEVEYELEPGPTLVKRVLHPRAHFFNELWRVLKPGSKVTIITPHWNSPRAYGDMTHAWPPVCEWQWLYLDKQWRPQNAPHDDFLICDFTHTLGYSLAAWVQAENYMRNAEFVTKNTNDALLKYKGAADDMQTTLVARK